MNSQSTKCVKCDFTHFFIYNGLLPSKMAVYPCTVEALNKSEFPNISLHTLRLREKSALYLESS
jgi:hypothetical protein